MDVIKKGTLPDNDPVCEGTCRKCGCEIRSKQSEGLSFYCPTKGCGETIYVLPVISYPRRPLPITPEKDITWRITWRPEGHYI